MPVKHHHFIVMPTRSQTSLARRAPFWKAYISYAGLIFKSEKSLISLTILSLMGLSLAWFLGQTAVIESTETSTILLCEISRLFCTLGPSILLSSYLHQLHQNGEVSLWLSGPLSRFQFIIQSFIIGFSICLFLLVLNTIFLYIFLNNISLPWVVSLLLESTLLLLVSLFFTLNFSSLLKTQTLICVIYFLGRLKGFFLASLSAPWLGYGDTSTILFKILLAPLPDFSLFYQHINSIDSLTPLALETFITSLLFLALTHISFYKKCL